VETIFRKIDKAAAFVPDLTLVSERRDGRPTPNPNVLIEYGWALKSLGHGRGSIRSRSPGQTGIPAGGGYGGSLATYMGGTAIWHAADEIIAKGTRIAAEALERVGADTRFSDARFLGTDRSLTDLLGLYDHSAIVASRNIIYSMAG
jgi:Molybdopterin-binding domain of aldehyde dehydrogenase